MKRTITSLLVGCMLLSMFAACTKSEPLSTSRENDPEQATSSSTEETSTPQTENTGESILPYTGETITYKGYGADLGVAEDENSAVFKAYKDVVGNINIDWELVPFSDFETKAKLYFNSGDIPDIVWYKTPDMMKDYGTSRMFLDYNQYKEYTPNWNKVLEDRPGLRVYETTNGEQFMIHDALQDYPGETFYANMDVLNKYDIAIPTNLQEFEDAMQKIRDADPSITPFHTYWKINYYQTVFGSLIGARESNEMRFDLSDKLWKHNVLEPSYKYKELITLLADYTARGFLNPEFTTMSDEQTKNLMASGKWAFTFCYIGDIHTWNSVEMDQPFPVNAEVMMPPAMEGVQPALRSAYVSDSPYWGYFISAKAKQPELAVSWVDAMLSEEVSTAFQWGIEGTSYTVTNGEKEWIPEFLAQGAQASKDLGIWNIQGPRFITLRDDLSDFKKRHESLQEVQRKLSSAIQSGELESYYYRDPPSLTDEAADEYSQIMTAAKTKMEEAEALFILGKRPISEWDAYIEEVKAVADIERAVELYNNGLQKPDRILRSERTYLMP